MQQYVEMNTPKGVMRGFFHIPKVNKFPVCLIFHGFTGNKLGTKFSYVEIARILEEKGVGTLRMDFLGSGDSDLSFKDMTFDDELSCARLMLEEMKALENVSDIYVVGHSMGGAVASELAKIYPNDIKKLCLWAPALNMPTMMQYLKGEKEKAEFYDHNGFEVSDIFVEDIAKRDFFTDLDIYKNELMIIHGTHDKTIPFDISKQYLQGYHNPVFVPIKGGSHNYDNLEHINEVINKTCEFLTGK